MRDAVIRILHKEKDDKTNTVIHKEVYSGSCKVNDMYSVREQLGGVENNSSISVLIFPSGNFPLECGDRCILDGKERVIRRFAKCLEDVSDGFRHIFLSLR